jgi:hypothetical protein
VPSCRVLIVTNIRAARVILRGALEAGALGFIHKYARQRPSSQRDPVASRRAGGASTRARARCPQRGLEPDVRSGIARCSGPRRAATVADIAATMSTSARARCAHPPLGSDPEGRCRNRAEAARPGPRQGWLEPRNLRHSRCRRARARITPTDTQRVRTDTRRGRSPRCAVTKVTGRQTAPVPLRILAPHSFRRPSRPASSQSGGDGADIDVVTPPFRPSLAWAPPGPVPISPRPSSPPRPCRRRTVTDDRTDGPVTTPARDRHQPRTFRGPSTATGIRRPLAQERCRRGSDRSRCRAQGGRTPTATATILRLRSGPHRLGRSGVNCNHGGLRAQRSPPTPAHGLRHPDTRTVPTTHGGRAPPTWDSDARHGRRRREPARRPGRRRGVPESAEPTIGRPGRLASATPSRRSTTPE